MRNGCLDRGERERERGASLLSVSVHLNARSSHASVHVHTAAHVPATTDNPKPALLRQRTGCKHIGHVSLQYSDVALSVVFVTIPTRPGGNKFQYYWFHSPQHLREASRGFVELNSN